MTRVHHAQHAPQRGSTLVQSRAVIKKKKPYKILLEAVTQEKKKLHSILTYASNAPTGFGFIPAGHPEVTEWCKEQCRQRNLDVHIVSAKPKNKMHSDPEKLSHHVHRVGHHFPLEIIDLACSKFGYTYDERHGLRLATDADRSNWIQRRFEDYAKRQSNGRPTTEKETRSQIYGAIREMFPKIPEADTQAIVTHAFEEGTNRVGNAKELTLARRVQLGVLAHIRHSYTDYDKLLKTVGWAEARSRVEPVSLAKLKEWRDETGVQSDEMEETFREVIVLDDDDDEASSGDDSGSTPDEREQSMEIVSSRATARDLQQPERHIDYPRIDVHAMRRVPRRTIVAQRYAPPPQPANMSAPSHSQPVLQQPLQQRRAPPPPESRPIYRGDEYHIAHSRTKERPRPAEPGPSPRTSQPIVREINGQLYQLQPIRENRGDSRSQYDPPSHTAPRRLQEGYVQTSSPRIRSFDRQSAHTRRPSDQDVVLPSVERETVDLTSPPRRAAAPQRPAQDLNALSRPYDDAQSPKRKAFPSVADDLGSHTGEYTKRLRPVYREEIHDRSYEGGGRSAFHPAFHPTQTMSPRSRPIAPPSQQVIDLTASPQRPPTGGGNGYYVPARSLAETSGHAYATTVRDVRGGYYEAPAGEPSHAYIPDTRLYERRAPQARDYIPLREARQPLRVEDESARYLRSGVRYGG